MEEFSQLISSVGFPIAAFLLMWYTQNKTLCELRDALKELTEYIKVQNDKDA